MKNKIEVFQIYHIFTFYYQMRCCFSVRNSDVDSFLEEHENMAASARILSPILGNLFSLQYLFI